MATKLTNVVIFNIHETRQYLQYTQLQCQINPWILRGLLKWCITPWNEGLGYDTSKFTVRKHYVHFSDVPSSVTNHLDINTHITMNVQYKTQ